MYHALIIYKDVVWNKVETNAAYNAAKNAESYNHDRMKRSDKELFDIYFDECKNQLVQLLLAYFDKEEIAGNDKYVVILNLKDFPEQLLRSLDSTVEDLFVHYILTRWLTMLSVSSDVTTKAAEEEAAFSSTARENLKRLLMRRTRPYQLKSQPL